MPYEIVPAVANQVDRKRIDVDQAFLLFVKLRNYHAVARALGCSPQAIQQRLLRHKRYAAVLANLETYKSARLDMMSAAELTLIRSLVDDKAIEKAPLAARATTYGILNERRRLEEGKSTSNQLHGVLLRVQREAIDAALQLPEGHGDDKPKGTHKPRTKKRKRRAKPA